MEKECPLYSQGQAKSHRSFDEANTSTDLCRVLGNHFADEAALKARETDIPEYEDDLAQCLKHHRQEFEEIAIVWQYCSS